MNDSPASEGRLLRAVSVLLAMVLIVAGMLKLEGLRGSHELVSGSASWIIQVVWAAFELAFGGWLLSGVYPRWTRLAALALFLTLLNVALSRALAGEASCGCLGRAKVSPWWAVAFDGAAVLLLAVSLPPSEAPRGRWRYAVAGIAILVAVIAGTVVSLRTTLGHSSSALAGDLPKGQRQYVEEIVRGIKQNEVGLHGLTFESRLVQHIAPGKLLTNDGPKVVPARESRIELVYRFTVTADGVLRIETGGSGRRELVRSGVMVEVVPALRTAWLRPAVPDPRNDTHRLDPSSWGFHVPLARPAVWFANVTVEQAELVPSPAGEKAKLNGRLANGWRFTAVFDPAVNYLPTDLDWFGLDGSLVHRTKVGYQRCGDRLAWLPEKVTTWYWPSGTVWSADEARTMMREERTVGMITADPATPAFIDIEIPEGYHVNRSVNEAALIDNLPAPSPAMALADPSAQTSQAAPRRVFWLVATADFILLLGLVTARRRLML